jgi:hypothetical protein
MAQGLPPQVKDKSKRTKVFDWTVPLRVGDRPAAIRGELRYRPKRFDWVGAIPAFVGLAVVLVAIGSVVAARQSSSGGRPDQRTGDSSSMPS